MFLYYYFLLIFIFQLVSWVEGHIRPKIGDREKQLGKQYMKHEETKGK